MDLYPQHTNISQPTFFNFVGYIKEEEEIVPPSPLIIEGQEDDSEP